MKITLLTIALLIVTTLAFAQAKLFKLTPNGFVSEADTTKDYIVLDAPNKTQADLYKTSLVYFSSNYRSPKDVISQVENEVLTINGYQQGAIHENGLATPFNINYTIVFKFKDNKIKVESPSFRLEVGQRVKYLVFTGFSLDGKESGVFGKKGKVKSERALKELEEFFSNFIARYQAGLLNEKKDW